MNTLDKRIIHSLKYESIISFVILEHVIYNVMNDFKSNLRTTVLFCKLSWMSTWFAFDILFHEDANKFMHANDMNEF